MEGAGEIELADRRSQRRPSSTATLELSPDGLAAPDEGALVPLNAVSLPQWSDRGFHAWAYLASAWSMDLLLWSYPFSYGVFLNYYTTTEFPESSRTVLALTGSISGGILYLSSLVLLPILRRYPAIKRKMIWGGFVTSIAGLVIAAYAKTPWQLVLTQGVLYSTGASVLYWPVLTYMFEWFSERKGFANGVIFSGASIGGAVFPYVIQVLLDKHGRKTALLVMAGILAAVPKPMNMQFLGRRVFWILCSANLIQGLGNFIPTLYIPSFATDLGVESAGTLGLALLNASSAIGQIMVGHLSDRSDLRITISLCAIGSTISVVVLWGLSSSLATIAVFSVFFGLFSTSWASLWPKFASIVAGDDAATAMALFVSGRGVGNVLAAPISEALLHPWAGTGKSEFAYGLGGYGPLILFTTATQLASVIGVVYKYFEKDDRRAISSK
ncbi:MFS general substrate transporter [Hymenopellis radicata]|nr:MFS general substrate transporter [Hymenopellis radicata]